MTLTVFLAVLAAAVMHAGWNVLVKLKLDRFLSLFLIQTLMGVMGLAMVAVFPLAAFASLPYALASGVLHLGYNLFLARSYRTGDLSQVYPIARGGAPLLTLCVTWFAAHEQVSPLGALGVLVLTSGIWLVSLAGKKQVRLDGMTLFFALGTSVFIAAYTVVDGLGGRASGSPSSYAGLVFVFDALFLLAYGVISRGPGIIASVAPFWRMGVAGAALSVGAYWIAIWAMSRAPISAVAALRETSILFVMLLSMRVLKEKVTGWRLGGAGLIAAGAILLRLS
ncbi:EamA family transporter [Aestuariivirga sp.]|uniref:EamA family transporter n=1 Tax=Aestuariivirga sp. TaxID=2650926 RepID=UPI0039E446D7